MYKIVVFAQQKWRSVTAKRFWTKIEGRDVPRPEIFLVPEAGLEPARYRYHRILSPARLPIPSFRQIIHNYFAILIS